MHSSLPENQGFQTILNGNPAASREEWGTSTNSLNGVPSDPKCHSEELTAYQAFTA
jgi:hypothetical protein